MIFIQVNYLGDDIADVVFLNDSDPDYRVHVQYHKPEDANRKESVAVHATTKVGKGTKRRTETITQRAVKIG